ncbi:Sec14p-like phosphatidylinositol transfer family protein [Abeliophyllum distichum]|uniref:Sec14p-like phosphatidylinositol transfer family protein n=1 Tax=Abeliophyllum distichum TaxID=126358 RepID=A0ABD1SVJ1_9LAMI
MVRYNFLCHSLLLELAFTMFRRKTNSQSDQESDELQHEHKVNELKDALGPLSGRSLQYCTEACLKRYLEARNWNVDKSKKMMEETLRWRAAYKPEEIRWPEVAIEGETGKVYRANFHDRHGRTVLILRPGMQNTASLDNQIRHLVYLIENAILNLPEAPPRIFEAFWKVVKYFLDAKTFQKVKFVYPKNKDSVELMRSYFDVDNLPAEFGGKATLQYDHEEFSRQMAQDDVKAAKLWGFDKPQSNGCGAAEVSPEPEYLAPPVS